MTSKQFAGAATLSLCLGAATPALAQDDRFVGFEGPQGANATLNIRVPLGAAARRTPPTFGLTVGIGRTVGGQAIDDRPIVRQWRLADLRFGGDGLRRAEVASFDLAHLDRDRRLNTQDDEEGSGRNRTWQIVLIAIASMGVGVVVEELLDNSSEEESPDTPPTSPGLG